MRSTIHTTVAVVSILSFIWVIIYKLVLLSCDAIFQGAQEIGEISFGLLSSLVASGIFYFFVVYLPEIRTKKIVDPIISRRLGTFGTSLFLLKKGIYEYKGLTIPEKIPTMEEFSEICKGITLHEPAPIIPGNPAFQPRDWYQFFQYFFDSDRYISRLLYDHIIYLDPKVVKLLDEIQYSVLQRALDIYSKDKNFDQLSDTSNPCWSYLKTIEELAEISKEMKNTKP